MALVIRASEREPDRPGDVRAFATALFLGLAYAANVGGLGTPIGTPPNLVMIGIFEKAFPEAPPITFLDWMLMACPLVLIFVPVIWLYLTRLAHPVADALDMGSKEILSEERARLGPLDVDALRRRVRLVPPPLHALARRARRDRRARVPRRRAAARARQPVGDAQRGGRRAHRCLAARVGV